MDRRRFLKAAALTGLAVSTPIITRDVSAAGPPYAGPFWILVNAGGGWDPTFMFNPSMHPNHNRTYTEIKKIGNIPYAPMPLDLAAIGVNDTYGYEQWLFDNEKFLLKFGSKLTVINGIDTSTNNHDAGNRTMWCGRIQEGYPALGALIAGAKAPEKPMAFISSGGYDSTQNVVPLTRVGSVSTLRKVAFPNAIDPNNLAGDKYHLQETYDLIATYQRERNLALQGGMFLPKVRISMDQLHLARLGENELEKLQIPANPVDLPGGDLNDLERLMQQAQLAIAAFKSGLAVACNVSIGGFDTHANHDTNQRRQQAKLLGGINYIMDELAAQGLADKTYVVAASDFGRSQYNGTSTNSGKDHWSITSVLAMGPGIPGNRLIGATTEDKQKPFNVDPGSLASLGNDKDGVRIRPEHIHRALRKVAGVEGTEVAQLFPLPGEDLPLFG